MIGRGRTRREEPPDPDGQQVGLAAYDARDPDGTFRPIEHGPPRIPAPSRPWLWPLRVLGIWLANLAALAVAGQVVTNVGATDPVAYVAWAAAFGLVNAGAPSAARRVRGRFGPLAAAGLALVLNAALVWLMTLVAPPFNAPDLAGLAKAAGVMWLANLPLRLLLPRRSRGSDQPV